MKKNEMTLVQNIIAQLIKLKAISEQEGKALQKAFKDAAKPSFVDFLLEEGLVEEGALLRALSHHYQVPSFDATGYFFKTFQLKKFPKDFLLRNVVIPIEVDENMMIMLASEPDDPKLLEQIGKHVSYDIRFRVGLKRDICNSIKEFYDRSVSEVPEDSYTKNEQRDVRDAERKGLKDEEEGDGRFLVEDEWN